MRTGHIAFAFAALALAGTAAAEPRTSSLGWARMPGAEACIGPRDLARAVEARLGRAALVPPSSAQVFVEGRVERAPDGFHAHVALSDEQGRVLGVRDLSRAGSDCRALDEEIALVVALLIDPDARLAPAGAPPPPPLPAPPPAPPKVVVERVLVPVPVATPHPLPPWTARLDAGPAFAVGLLPGAAVGLTLRAELAPPRLFPFELGGTAWLDTRTSGDAKGAIVSLSSARLGACPLALTRPTTSLRGCAALEVGAIRAEGFGLQHPTAQEQAIVDGALAGRVYQRLVGPLEAALGLALVIPFQRTRFLYRDADGVERELYRTGPVAAALDVGLGVAFP